MAETEKDLWLRQATFLKNYFDPNSETFGNATQSGIRAGYSEEYSRNIMSLLPDWLSENIDNGQMLQKAEKSLKEFLEMNTKKDVKVGQEVVLVEDPQLSKIKQDTAKFVAERLGKKKWSSRTEHTGEDGKEITVRLVNYGDSNSVPVPTETVSVGVSQIQQAIQDSGISQKSGKKQNGTERADQKEPAQ